MDNSFLPLNKDKIKLEQKNANGEMSVAVNSEAQSAFHLMLHSVRRRNAWLNAQQGRSSLSALAAESCAISD